MSIIVGFAFLFFLVLIMVKNHKQQKDAAARASEVQHLMDQVMELGIPLDHEGFQQFISIAKEFESHASSASGKIKLVGFKRMLVYKFSNQAHISSTITLVHNPHI
jgi:hypothetical protein